MKNTKHPNLLFIMCDQWRRHAVGCMKSDPVITPNIDNIASEGVVFENAFSCNPVCTPNRAAFLTGKHPFSINMMYNWLRLPVNERSIAHVARDNGYDTGYIGKWHLDEWEGGDEAGDAWNCLTPKGERRMGFDFWYSNGCVHNHYDLKYITTDNEVVEGKGWQVDHETDVAIDYLNSKKNSENPFCLFVSYAPPHTHHGEMKNKTKWEYQFSAPEKYEDMYRDKNLPVRENAMRDMYLDSVAGYFGAITSIDDNIGRILETLEENGNLDDTIIVITSDHGEMLGSHGLFIKDVWFEESVGIPLIIRYPKKIKGGLRENALINTPDVMPTILSLMGCEYPSDVQGMDLSGCVVEGKERVEHDAVFFSFNGGSPPRELVKWDCFPNEGNRKWRAIRTKKYTYVAASREQYGNTSRFRPTLPEGVKEVLYDLENDPYQNMPIYPSQGYDDIMKSLHEKLSTWLDEIGDPFLKEQWY